MLERNININLNINAPCDVFFKVKDSLESIISDTDVTIVLHNNNSYIDFSLKFDSFDEELVKEAFKYKKILLTNGINEIYAYSFYNINLLASNTFYGFCNDLNIEKELYLINIPGDVKMSLSAIPNKKDSFFFFSTFKNMMNTTNMYYSTEPRCFRSDVLKCMCYIISKNCCSSIVNLLYNTDVEPVDKKWEPWEPKNIKDVYSSSIFTTIKQTKEQKFKNYRRFIILRDPIERFISIVNYSKGRWNNIGMPYMYNYLYSRDKEEVIDVVLAIIKGLNLLENLQFHDDHYMRQIDHISNIDLMDVDDLVLNKDLTDYVKTVYNADIPIVNQCLERFISKEDINERQLNEIKELFADDFLLLEHSKLWKK